MSQSILIATILAVLCIGLLSAHNLPLKMSQTSGDFATFKVRFNKKYASIAEERKRFACFQENVATAAKHQAANPQATFDAARTPFSDLCAAEFRSIMKLDRAVYAEKAKQHASQAHISLTSAVTEKRKIDWRNKNAVTPVQSQGQCGNDYVYCACSTIASQYAIINNEPAVPLSEQYLMSIDTYDQGCNGGLMDNAIRAILTHNDGQVATLASCPNSGENPNGGCNGTLTWGAKVLGVVTLPAKSEATMANFVTDFGTLMVAVDATSWQTYTGGVLTKCTGTAVDHGVQVVGFDDQAYPPYWIIKNSWGADWGESGYIRVEKGKNECLIDSMPSSVYVARKKNF